MRIAPQFEVGRGWDAWLAIVVRCMLLPAVLEPMGTATWRLPRWLDDRLPQINIEGAAARAQYGADVAESHDAPLRAAEAEAA